jgi:hypothetical protein
MGWVMSDQSLNVFLLCKSILLGVKGKWTKLQLGWRSKVGTDPPHSPCSSPWVRACGRRSDLQSNAATYLQHDCGQIIKSLLLATIPSFLRCEWWYLMLMCTVALFHFIGVYVLESLWDNPIENQSTLLVGGTAITIFISGGFGGHKWGLALCDPWIGLARAAWVLLFPHTHTLAMGETVGRFVLW